jgi:hypothetical protein
LDLPATDVNVAMETPGYERDDDGWTPVHLLVWQDAKR